MNSKINRIIYFLIIFFILTTAFTLIYQLINYDSSKASKQNTHSAINKKQKSDSLENAVQSALEGTKGTYGVVIKNLKTGQSYNTNEHKVYESGSLYKLWVMATTYKQIENNTLTKDQQLSEDVTTLNEKFNIDPSLAELTDGTITLSVHDALNQMITISHNYAALLLTETVKLSNVSSFLKNNGFTESKVGVSDYAPTSTPEDIALFFEKLYKEEFANEKDTKEMIDFLKNQQLNEKLPKYLPLNTVVAHKTGEINSVTHDAGIVYAPFGDYIIVVLSDSDSPDQANERIAGISKSVYNYFTKI